MKKRIYNIALAVAVIAVSLTSCVKDELYNTTHPATGKVIVDTDWSRISEDAAMPQSYIIGIAGQSMNVSGPTNIVDRVLNPGEYTLGVYNIPEGMNLEGIVMSVNKDANGYLNPMPEHLFASYQNVAVKADTDMKIGAPMTQYTRRLEINLNVSEGEHRRVSAATGTLTGVCGSIDISNGKRSESPETVCSSVVQDNDNFSVSFRLLGIIPSMTQKLTLKLIFTNGDTQMIESDITGNLTGFNSDISVLKLNGNLTLPSEGDFSGVITGWKVADGGNADAH